MSFCRCGHFCVGVGVGDGCADDQGVSDGVCDGDKGCQCFSCSVDSGDRVGDCLLSGERVG